MQKTKVITMNGNSNVIAAIAADEDIGKRADVFVSRAAGVTRSAAANLIEKGAVLINGKKIAKSVKVQKDDVLEVEMPEPEMCEVAPENIPLDIVYEDDDILVINKPKGMVVHPACGNYEGTLVNALLGYCKDSFGNFGGRR